MIKPEKKLRLFTIYGKKPVRERPRSDWLFTSYIKTLNLPRERTNEFDLIIIPRWRLVSTFWTTFQDVPFIRKLSG